MTNSIKHSTTGSRREGAPYLTLDRIEASRASSDLISTRDLDVNWEAWEDHVFFGSAKARLDSASHYIRSTFPFDGTREDLNEWRRNLSGWQDYLLGESWVYHLRSARFFELEGPPSTEPAKPPQVPAIYGVDFEALERSRTASEVGTSPDLSGERRRALGRRNLLNPGDKPLSVEFWFRLDDPESTSSGSINSSSNSGANQLTEPRGIATHRNLDGEGWTVFVDASPNGLRFGCHLAINPSTGSSGLVPGSNIADYFTDSVVSSRVYDPEEWHHVNVTWSSAESGREPRLIINGERVAIQRLDLTGNSNPSSSSPSSSSSESTNALLQSSGIWATEILDPLWVGWTPSPQRNESGDADIEFSSSGGFYLDEFRIWHAAPSLRQVGDNRFRTVWAQEGLVLQYRFNDSPETLLNFQGSTLLGVLDSSGNAIHGQRQGDPEQELVPKLVPESPEALREREEDHPSIYPLDSELQAILGPLSASAADYDEANPNLVTKLVPPHLFENPLLLPVTQIQEDTELARSADGAYLLAALLYTWADFWDDLKLRGDALVTALHLNPDGTGSARALLPLIAKELGVELPMPFEEVKPEAWDEEFEEAQERIWRRLLLALPDIIRRKGTISGIRSLFSSVGGLQVDGALRFREWGNTTSTTKQSREEVEQQIRFLRTEAPPMLRFTRSSLVGGSST